MKKRGHSKAASIARAAAGVRFASGALSAQQCSGPQPESDSHQELSLPSSAIWGFGLHDKQQLLSPLMVRGHTQEAG